MLWVFVRISLEGAEAAPVEGGEGADVGAGREERWTEGVEERLEGEEGEEGTGHVPEFEHGAVTAGDEAAPSRPNRCPAWEQRPIAFSFSWDA